MRAHDSYWSPLLSPYPSPFQVGREIPWRCSSNIVYVEEPLLNSLEKKLSGIQFNDPFPTKEVTEAYCDDINIITNDLNDFSKIEVEVREFERLSGAILSRSQKSMVMGIGRWKNREEWPIPWLLSVKSLKVFGIFIAETYNEIMKLNWEYETALAGPVRHLSDRSIRSMDRSEIFENSGTGPRSLFSKQMN